jgi:hypothetical protein
MSQREKSIPFCNPEVVPRMIFMVVCIHDDFRTKCIAEFKESIPAMDKAGIDQQPINKEGMNLEKGKTQETAGHLNGGDRVTLPQANRDSIHTLSPLEYLVKKT